MCRIELIDDDGSRSMSDGERTARKEHRCSECRRTIQKGERYHFATFAFDGGIHTFRSCLHCMVAQRWLMRNCSGFIWNEVAEDIRDHAEEYRRADLARLWVGMKRKWRRFTADALMPVPTMPGELS